MRPHAALLAATVLAPAALPPVLADATAAAVLADVALPPVLADAAAAAVLALAAHPPVLADATAAAVLALVALPPMFALLVHHAHTKSDGATRLYRSPQPTQRAFALLRPGRQTDRRKNANGSQEAEKRAA